MPKLKIIDRDGYHTCRKCLIEYKCTNENFHVNNRLPKKFNIYCKICDNKRRSESEKEKKYHNLPKRCAICESFFYISLAYVNKRLKMKNYNNNFYCSRKCVSKHTKHFKWNGKRQGSLNPSAKLSEDKVREIKLFLKDGFTLIDLHTKYNVSLSTLKNIKYSRTWTHITV